MYAKLWGLSQAISSNVTVVYIDKTEWVGTLLSKQCAGRMFEQAVQLLHRSAAATNPTRGAAATCVYQQCRCYIVSFPGSLLLRF